MSSFSGVSVSSDGSAVYAAGSIYGIGAYNFGNGVTAAGTSNGYNPVLVKYSSTGSAQWAQTVTAGAYDSTFNGVSVASDGSVCATGYFAGTGTYTFGTVTVTGAFNDGNVLLVKYDSTGVAQWAQTVTTGTGDSFFTSVSAAASDGSVYAAGYIQGNGIYNFNPSVAATGANSNGINLVLVKYNSLGVAQWAQTVAGSDSSDFFGVSVATDGSVHAAGLIGTGTFDFGNGVTATGTSGNNIVLVKYDSFGVASWAQTVAAGNGASSFSGVAEASGGYVYAAGYIQGTGTCGFGSGATATGTYIGSNVVLVGY